MAQPTNVVSSYDVIGNREDLTDIMSDVSVLETPVYSAIGRTKAKSRTHEWQTIALKTATAGNAVIEGDSSTTDAGNISVRLQNVCQISDKVLKVTETQLAIDHAGVDDEMELQMEMAMKELKRDIEMMICDNGAYVVGSDGTPREAAGIPAWLTSNTSFGGGAGADPVTIGATARTDGTQRVFTEDLFLNAMQDAFTNGGRDISLGVVGPFNKRKVSLFSGGATRIDKSEDGKLFSAVNVIVTDFGTVNFVPSIFNRARDCLLINPEYMKVAWLRNLYVKDLPADGSFVSKKIECELTLQVANEAAHAGVFDLTTS